MGAAHNSPRLTVQWADCPGGPAAPGLGGSMRLWSQPLHREASQQLMAAAKSHVNSYNKGSLAPWAPNATGCQRAAVETQHPPSCYTNEHVLSFEH